MNSPDWDDLSEGGDCVAMAVLVSGSETASSVLFDTIGMESRQNKLLQLVRATLL